MLRIANRNFMKISSCSRFSSTAAPSLNSDSTQNTQDSKVQQIISNDIKENNPVPVFKRALLRKSIALKDKHGEFSYLQLAQGSFSLASQISDLCGEKNWSLFIDR